jgi:hypothetical protein
MFNAVEDQTQGRAATAEAKAVEICKPKNGRPPLHDNTSGSSEASCAWHADRDPPIHHW